VEETEDDRECLEVDVEEVVEAEDGADDEDSFGSFGSFELRKGMAGIKWLLIAV